MPDLLPHQDITVEQMKERLDSGEKLFILDVRQPDEYAAAKFDDAVLIPLNELPGRIGELDATREIIVHCRMGGRSASAAAFLRQRGFRDVKNLAGGIMAWASRVDPTMRPI